MKNDLLYNAAGAKDETAYRAIISVMKGNKEMGVMGVKKGEVWDVESGVATRYVVVIECYEDYAATIMLQDFEPKENSVKVIARGVMYADAGRLGYVFYDKFLNFVRRLNQEEDQQLRRAIGKALDIEPLESLEVDIFRLREELAKAQGELKAKAEELEEAYDHMEANARLAEEAESRAVAAEAVVANQGTVELVEDHSLREDLAAARKEAEIYKGLYEDMLRRALG